MATPFSLLSKFSRLREEIQNVLYIEPREAAAASEREPVGLSVIGIVKDGSDQDILVFSDGTGILLGSSWSWCGRTRVSRVVAANVEEWKAHEQKFAALVRASLTIQQLKISEER